MGIKVEIKKCLLPTIFIDTYIINNISKILNNEFSDRRYTEIYSLLKKLIDNKKLICPHAHQDEEFLQIDRLNDLCYKVLDSLSRGLKFFHYTEIENYEYDKACEGFIKNDNSLVYKFNDIINQKIYSYLNNNNKLFFTIDKSNQKPFFKQFRETNKNITSEWELLRDSISKRKKYKDFNSQLKLEYEGDMIAIKELIRSIKGEKDNTHKCQSLFNDLRCFLYKTRKIFDYKFEDLNVSKFNNLIAYYKSDFYKKIPCVDISCKITAYLLTSKGINNLNISDQMDIKFISFYLPFCDMAILDAKMINIIKHLKINELYNVKVFSIRNFSDIKNYLESLL